ncbi:bacteriohemerythrin [Pelosinus sp. sgz500959]|uniref:bacteriohemerythrin n=1 Tax=Pelosinus sp. sgz500959 TaxID=3242472 RepID=UPI0036710F1E
MALIKWDAKLNVNVPEFDEEHKKLVQMINSLHDAMKSGKGKELLTKILDEATDYTLKHFVHEEKIMVQYKYPEYKEHKATHDEFAKKIVELRNLHDQQRLPSNQMLNTLNAWLINHINDVDKKYSPFLIKVMK